MRARSERLWRTFVAANCLAVLAVAVALRVWGLNHVPGLNGDEAWMGVQALRFLDGQPVAWLTPTGNPMNVFHFLPQVALHAALPPSVVTLRLTVLISGILALVVNYLLCQYTFHRRSAAISTLVLAVLPVNIAYCRFAWDASQSLLFTLPIVYGSLLAVRQPNRAWKWLLMAGISQLAALVVHPTNIFVAPLIVVSACTVYRVPLSRALLAARSRWGWVAIGFGGVTGFAAVGILLKRWVLVAGRRLVDPGEMGLFAGNYVDFFSGSVIYQFIAGTQRDPAELSTMLYRVAALFVMGCVAYGIYHQLRLSRQGHRTLLLGVAGITLGLFLIAGPRAVAPHTERYAIGLIGATALLAAFGIAWWVRRSGRIATVSWIVAAWAVLAVFHCNYLHFIKTTGGESHRAFRTTTVEPKLAAILSIVGRQVHGQPVCILAREWWSYWPAEYFTFTSDCIRVVSVPGNDPIRDREFEQLSDNEDSGDCLEQRLATRVVAAVRATELAGNVYLMEFAESAEVERMEKQLAKSGYRADTTLIRDGAGRPLIILMRPILP